MIEFKCASLDDTKKAAEYFAKFAKPGQCFALYGNLGSGKTTFSQFLIKSLISTVGHVASPTFTIVQTYNDGDKLEIWHVDCYRLNDREEFLELGLEEDHTFLPPIIIPKGLDLHPYHMDLRHGIMKWRFAAENNTDKLWREFYESDFHETLRAAE